MREAALFPGTDIEPGEIRSTHRTNHRRSFGKLALAGALIAPLGACTLDGVSLDGVPLAAEISIAGWNTEYSNSKEKVATGVEQLAAGNPGLAGASGADIINLQETYRADRRAAILEKLSADYDHYFADKAPDLPIFWKKSIFEQVGNGHDIQVHDTLHFDDGGGGGSKISDRHIVWVELVTA